MHPEASERVLLEPSVPTGPSIFQRSLQQLRALLDRPWSEPDRREVMPPHLGLDVAVAGCAGAIQGRLEDLSPRSDRTRLRERTSELPPHPETLGMIGGEKVDGSPEQVGGRPHVPALERSPAGRAEMIEGSPCDRRGAFVAQPELDAKAVCTFEVIPEELIELGAPGPQRLLQMTRERLVERGRSAFGNAS